ncbi:hypothetical protein [Sphingobium sp. CFD-1]|uniref:hypothetical protein n=1 Tax=Sphingobium sp. CFD-1 TaxID=2878545 RepID=UPI00214A9D81|nr:hypothetical protein [Sphingobium sp. CFD-1]
MKAIRAAAAQQHSIDDADAMLSRLREPHCFDLSAVMEFAEIVMKKTPVDVLQTTLFPPAPQTWLEVRGTHSRSAYFIDQQQDGSLDVFRFFDDTAFFVANYAQRETRNNLIGEHEYVDDEEVVLTWLAISVFLAIINTPKLVDRRSRHPHKALARELRQSSNSRIQLRPWTEIRLDLNPQEATGEGAARISGRKCLHFCRSHIRIQNGKLTIVRPHWRGDSALGVSQSRYVVTA